MILFGQILVEFFVNLILKNLVFQYYLYENCILNYVIFT